MKLFIFNFIVCIPLHFLYNNIDLVVNGTRYS